MRTAYSASKWAVRGITRTVALEVGKYNINVNAVCPGIVDGPRMQKLCEEKASVRGWTADEVYQEYVEDMALKRVTQAEDIANAVLFMASDDSRQITGQHIAGRRRLGRVGRFRTPRSEDEPCTYRSSWRCRATSREP